MFYALTQDKIDTGGLRFVHQLEDIETLNRRALQGELEVSAVSIHAYAHLADQYALLASGCSMGDRYGPKLIARRPMTLDEARGAIIAIPGTLTTAYLALQLGLGKEVATRVVPFDQILPSVLDGRFEVGLIIHEGQLYYPERGLHQVVDLGQWWFEQTGLPLPLGGNVVRRDLGEATVRQIARLLKQSIARPPRRGAGLRPDLCPGPGSRAGGPICRNVRQRVDRRLRPGRPRGGSHPVEARRGQGTGAGAGGRAVRRLNDRVAGPAPDAGL
jgi:predicted solute-binding protein